MKLLSDAIADGSAIPRRFTCDGDNLSPPLEWSDPHQGTRSYVLLCDDPDAPGGTWHHWAVYDIPTAQARFSDSAAQKTKLKQTEKSAMAGHVHRPDMALTTTIFGCLHSRPIIYGSRKIRHAVTSNERPASSRLAKPFSSAGIRASPGAQSQRLIRRPLS